MTPLDLVIEPEEGNANEVGGILNPGAARGPDGHLYLFPRIVAESNYSRIGILRVLFDEKGEPSGVERVGVALEPETPYELRPDGGGCEDPRVSFVEPLNCYLRSYTAFGPDGPRIAVAQSNDLLSWERLGLAEFDPYEGIHFDGIDNKDACMFPVAIPNPEFELEVAILHRPLFPGTLPMDTLAQGDDRTVDLHRESIWISYRRPGPIATPLRLTGLSSHHRLAAPVYSWEALKIGSGAPPVMTKHGWLFVYHGVADVVGAGNEEELTYSAGVMVLDRERPQELLYRSSHPVLTPEQNPKDPRRGSPKNVVFPTGLDRRDDIGQPDRFDVYYGLNDFRIGVARLDVPDVLPHTGEADPPSN
jgi:predicted GH43/DUF377 family glycosyl hydrolase